MSDDTKKPAYVEPKAPASEPESVTIQFPGGGGARVHRVDPTGPLPPVPPLPTREQLSRIPPEMVRMAYEGLMQVLVLYAKADRMDDVRAAAAQLNELEAFAQEMASSCECETCTAERAAEAKAAAEAGDVIGKAAGSANVVKPLGRAPDGSLLN
jgi:hypothetical protein